MTQRAGPKLGKPRDYTYETYDKIIERIASGESIVQISKDPDMPSRPQIYKFFEVNEDYQARRKAAEKLRCEALLDQILEIADDESKDHNASAVYRANCRIKTRQWLLSIYDPQRFSNYSRQEVAHKGAAGMQPVINVTYSGDQSRQSAQEADPSDTEHSE